MEIKQCNMKTTTTILLFGLMMGSGFGKEMETDNKAIESKPSAVLAIKDNEKVKTEKRAPVVMTSVPGELKYSSDIKYSQPPIRYILQDSPKESIEQSYYQPTSVPKTNQYYTYNSVQAPVQSLQHPMQHQQMVLMFAVPHPSGQFLMLIPAQNFLYPMFYRPQVQHSQAASQYQPNYSAAPALAQSAGFAAQQQLVYSGPYRTKNQQ